MAVDPAASLERERFQIYGGPSLEALLPNSIATGILHDASTRVDLGVRGDAA